jgi:hypothetical protein
MAGRDQGFEHAERNAGASHERDAEGLGHVVSRLRRTGTSSQAK